MRFNKLILNNSPRILRTLIWDHRVTFTSSTLSDSFDNIYFSFSVIEETMVIKVIVEPVLKLNTGILKCQVPNSMKHQVQIVSWKFGNNYIYPTKTWTKGK